MIRFEYLVRILVSYILLDLDFEKDESALLSLIVLLLVVVGKFNSISWL